MSADLNAIRLKVRRVTKNPSQNQLTNAELDDYINTYYLYDFPEHLRLLNLKELFTLTLQPNVDIYNFTPNANVSLQPPAYVQGNEILFSQNREDYFTLYPEVQNSETFATGNGTPGPYSGSTVGTPVKRNRVLISTVDVNGNPLSARDVAAGTFTGDVVAGSTINYLTGAIANVTWSANVAAGEEILVQYVPYQSARPQAVLFYDDTLQFSPVPDQAYDFNIETFITPTQLLAGGSEPTLREWWQLLAYGASLKIFADRLDMENYTKVQILYNEQQRLVERRTMKQLSPQRVSTIYTDDFNFVTPFRSGQ